MNKILVLDTNVLLYDYKCIYNFRDNDVVIPIVVLEELDKFKKGSETINFHAREFVRELNKLAELGNFKEGIVLGERLGKLFIVKGAPFNDDLSTSFPEKTADHRILAIASKLKEQYAEYDSNGLINKNYIPKKVILVSQDINLRMKALSLGIDAEDYKAGKIEDTNIVDKQADILKQLTADNIDKLYVTPKGLSPVDLGFTESDYPQSNEYFILKCDTSSALAYYDKNTDKLIKIDKKKIFGIEPKNAEQSFAMHALLNNDCPLIVLTGKAGCLYPDEKIKIYKMKSKNKINSKNQQE